MTHIVHFVVVALLASAVLFCWLGVLGMWRMREPMQALHYLALPASVGMVLLCVAVFLEEGVGQVALKTLLIALILLAFNSVVTHATARAFRVRALGTGDSPDTDALAIDSARVGGSQP